MKPFKLQRGVLLAALLTLAGGCTDDGTAGTGTGAPVGVASARPGQSGQVTPVATPDRSGALVAYPTLKPVPARTPYIPPAYIAPSPATPDPNAPLASPRVVQPTASPAPTLFTIELGKLGAPALPQTPTHAVTLRDQASLRNFLQTALGTTSGSLPAVDFTSQELLALYDPGSQEPGSGCLDPTIGSLKDLGSALAFQVDPTAAAINCDGSSTALRDRTFTFLQFARSSKPILNAPDWVINTPTRTF
jgi:hypothetical protein